MEKFITETQFISAVEIDMTSNKRKALFIPTILHESQNIEFQTTENHQRCGDIDICQTIPLIQTLKIKLTDLGIINSVQR